MKTLYLVRHAKSSWEHSDASDHDRPLNKRGERDAQRMGRLLAKRNPHPELIVSSSALRAFSTASAFARALGMPGDAVRTSDGLYLADEAELRAVIASLDTAVASAMLVGHNPGMSVLASVLAHTHVSMSTCAIAAIACAGASWSDLAAGAETHLLFFERPVRED